jgi:hypothetical protein
VPPKRLNGELRAFYDATLQNNAVYWAMHLTLFDRPPQLKELFQRPFGFTDPWTDFRWTEGRFGFG